MHSHFSDGPTWGHVASVPVGSSVYDVSLFSQGIIYCCSTLELLGLSIVPKLSSSWAWKTI
jgi:hypothetical protein